MLLIKYGAQIIQMKTGLFKSFLETVVYILSALLNDRFLMTAHVTILLGSGGQVKIS